MSAVAVSRCRNPEVKYLAVASRGHYACAEMKDARRVYARSLADRMVTAEA
jgi:hypothetical protein